MTDNVTSEMILWRVLPRKMGHKDTENMLRVSLKCSTVDKHYIMSNRIKRRLFNVPNLHKARKSNLDPAQKFTWFYSIDKRFLSI